ncbi:MAG TPA: aminoacyl-tRNA hydrolase [Acidimicrobiales bacterium]|nr:aminoacyl-tRNA hydrolase [Acidimicrobiales bacterium]
MVGLGNPGEEYARTRHNVGADAVNLLAERHGGRLRVLKAHRAGVAEVRIGEARVALAVPTTYMNESGTAVRALLRRFGVGPPALVVVHDELDLPPGTLRVKVGGGTAGHNGLRSVQAHLHSADFLRVRIGVGKPPHARSGADYVLRRPAKAERELLDVAIADAADAVELIATEGAEAAMNRYNRGR